MKALCCTALILSSLNLLQQSHAIKQEYNDIVLDSFAFWQHGPVAMYTIEKAPAGKMTPYVRYNLTFTRDESLTGKAVLEVLVVNDLHVEGSIGENNGDGMTYCCTTDMFESGHPGCSNGPGTLITTQNFSTHVYHFDEDVFEVSEGHVYQVSDTSLHYLIIANCDGDKVGNVTFNGFSEWKNPYGYLPADIYGFLPFYKYMSVVYVAVAGVWFCLNAYFWKELLQLQNCITAVLALCMIEMGTWYVDYLNFNEEGVRHTVPFVIGILTTVIRRTVSRMLVVAVSMGFGVVKPNLPEKKKIFALGAIYFVFGSTYELFVHVNQTTEVNLFWKLVVTVPVAVLDGTFYWWIFVSLSDVLSQLKQRKQYAKLQLYQRFSRVLGVSLLCAVGFAIYQMYYMGAHRDEFPAWSQLWFLEAGFWQSLYTLILFAIMILWRPSSNSRRYAYAAQIASDDYDDDQFEMEMSGDVDTVAVPMGGGGVHSGPDSAGALVSGGVDLDQDPSNEMAGAQEDELEQQRKALFTIDPDEENAAFIGKPPPNKMN